VDRGEENQVEVGWAAQLPLQRPLGERCRGVVVGVAKDSVDIGVRGRLKGRRGPEHSARGEHKQDSAGVAEPARLEVERARVRERVEEGEDDRAAVKERRGGGDERAGGGGEEVRHVERGLLHAGSAKPKQEEADVGRNKALAAGGMRVHRERPSELHERSENAARLRPARIEEQAKGQVRGVVADRPEGEDKGKDAGLPTAVVAVAAHSPLREDLCERRPPENDARGEEDVKAGDQEEQDAHRH